MSVSWEEPYFYVTRVPFSCANDSKIKPAVKSCRQADLQRSGRRTHTGTQKWEKGTQNVQLERTRSDMQNKRILKIRLTIKAKGKQTEGERLSQSLTHIQYQTWPCCQWEYHSHVLCTVSGNVGVVLIGWRVYIWLQQSRLHIWVFLL